MMETLLLARMQFAANITFHILFPTIWLLLFFRLRWLATRDGADRVAAQGWLDACRFWTKVFALTFALGVVSGITMSFQCGTNWPGFMQKVGNIAGPLPGYEVLMAFFFGFLALAYSIYPYVELDQLTIWQAASSPEALKVIRFGTCISVPAIAGCTVFSYRVFRGKTGELKYA